jgi:hypothetical protein
MDQWGECTSEWGKFAGASGLKEVLCWIERGGTEEHLLQSV